MNHEERIKQVLYGYIDAGLITNDSDKVLSYLTEDVMGYGMGEQGFVESPKDVRDVMTAGIKQDEAVYELDYEQVEVRVHGGLTANVCAKVIIRRIIGDEITISGLMQSLTMCYEKDDWYICSLHASPIILTEESIEAYPLKFAENTLAKLRSDLQIEAFELMNQSISGGILGSYYEDNVYPLYFVNDSMLMNLGYSREEFETDFKGDVAKILYQEDREWVLESFRETFRSKKDCEIRFRVVNKEGTALWMLERARFTKDDMGKDIVIGIFVDVTEIVTLQEELEILTNNVPGGVCTLRMDGYFTILFANKFFYDLFGYSQEQFEMELQNQVIRCIAAEDVKKVLNAVSSAYDNQENRFEFETQIQKRSGEFIWVLVCGSFQGALGGTNVHSVVLDITERKQMEQALRLSEERFRIALEKTSNTIFDYDMINKKIMHSDLLKNNFNSISSSGKIEELIILGGTINPDYLAEFLKAFALIESGEPQSICIIKAKLTEGEEIWNKVSMSGIKDHNGCPVRVIGMIEDITLQKETELAYIREEQFRKAILADTFATYIINFTKDKIESCKVPEKSPCFMAEAGTAYDRYLREESKSCLFKEDRTAFLAVFSVKNVVEAFEHKETDLKLEYRFICPDGKVIWMLTKLQLTMDAVTKEIKGFMYVLDIDKQKREELELTHRSEIDSMTQIYNKETTIQKIREILMTDSGISTGVFMMLDVDRFKDINDNYGHPFGDKILIDTAKLLIESFREGDVVGRFGGDEFCVFISGIRSRKKIEESAASVCRMVSNIFIPEDNRPGITCSIGISVCNGTVKSFEQIYQEADSALYTAKESGRNRYFIFDSR